MAFSPQDIALALGGLAGNRGQAYAGGASAAVYDQLTRGQDLLRSKIYEAGRWLGPILGKAIPAQLAAGAAATGAEAEAALEKKYAGLSLTELLMGAAVGVVAVVALWTLTPSFRR